MQVEELCDFFSQKKNYEEISAILQVRRPRVRGYSVGLMKRKNFSRDLSTLLAFSIFLDKFNVFMSFLNLN